MQYVGALVDPVNVAPPIAGTCRNFGVERVVKESQGMGSKFAGWAIMRRHSGAKPHWAMALRPLQDLHRARFAVVRPDRTFCDTKLGLKSMPKTIAPLPSGDYWATPHAPFPLDGSNGHEEVFPGAH
ncbi:protein of unknown function (plasmid) [Cupriavidus taiwanensis]|uniref:Uncharacterized protein n=1 Tax=Cupriavidus taiwanensis TaxID=164546 RepID=A0A375ISX9_9BURK|nr:protein of unknown function [Cupriavidus taiwanensis]